MDYSVIIFLLGTFLLLIITLALIRFVVFHKRRQLAHLFEKAALQHTFDNQLLQARLETQEQSFQYFSEEIHDNVGQVLSVVGMHIYQLQAECKGEHAQKLVQQSSDLLNKAIGDLRAISHTLNTQYISKAGLIDVLRQELDYINSVKGANCNLNVKGEPQELSADRQTLLYRILQEAVGNALKHAKATEISIDLNYSSGILTILVIDNGNGFDSLAIDNTKAGLGLTNMQIRANLLGGNLLIQSKPGQGTTLSLSIDIHPELTTLNEPNT